MYLCCKYMVCLFKMVSSLGWSVKQSCFQFNWQIVSYLNQSDKKKQLYTIHSSINELTRLIWFKLQCMSIFLTISIYNTCVTLIYGNQSFFKYFFRLLRITPERDCLFLHVSCLDCFIFALNNVQVPFTPNLH